MADLFTVMLSLWLGYEAVHIILEVRQSQHGRTLYTDTEFLCKDPSDSAYRDNYLRTYSALHKGRIQVDPGRDGKLPERTSSHEADSGERMPDSYKEISR